ncbi:tetratricopeptide repeat protein [Thauera sp. Sel9]|uniref:tetratricopeptide repeat protein n=1 Tax=Thauera sp. Sel9 TaxID=2974299 RepID=UPI0021E15EC4|nr:tetratricopeptide repeat protein [Thauera sp. Sel9]MCV2217543.1 tetratricopeptide repeat protein [Thauera sp. Sel9]
MINLSRHARACFVSVALCAASPLALGQTACADPFSDGSSPADYRMASEAARRLVERVHFTDDVRMMRRGGSTNQIAADIAYTLRKFPNHHEALMTMGNYSLKVKLNPPPGAQYSVECWFDRALRFTPDDAMVKTVYGLYLIKRNKHNDAIAQLEAALAQAGDNANVHYNLGLAYFDLKRYDKALESAHAAYRMGFPLPGLKNKLARVGAWREP